MDALNQLPRVFVRGENNNMLQHLYNLDEIAARMSRRSTAAGDGAVHEKKMYENYVFKLGRKPAWYNEFDADAVQCAKVSYFNNLFGYGRFKDYIVGFKEIRFSAVRDALVNATKTDVYWVYFEDMFDPGVNGTVADGLAAFLGVGKPNNFTFARLPRSAKCCR
ncbi:hypothetical protein Rsub_10753 [Raphidocelis subcapitata]|uniref:Uncharacterized protein n=1 Tax=Raphidocelis subcapitata TaxID=307507 RepID=A0A2V0PJX7_9CHLO|nr:hypothetical protein Rsub_10753 [Raphidocelis subcapitata]|eukprot:GBF97617.1 hypothetical protein Rsub_10753 [Raphidocelis subcapitata]